ncbi:MAG: fibronectin type III domain-containing protein, partial [Oscillospiraceae bacterium]|nr:fibronectin type III domain-containing protein [Oscillospiraceae bacterium]
SWDKAAGADMYRVYMYNAKTKKYEKYKDVKSPKCKISGLKAGTKYKFKVVSYDKNAKGKYEKGESSKAVSVTTKK